MQTLHPVQSGNAFAVAMSHRSPSLKQVAHGLLTLSIARPVQRSAPKIITTLQPRRHEGTATPLSQLSRSALKSKKVYTHRDRGFISTCSLKRVSERRSLRHLRVISKQYSRSSTSWLLRLSSNQPKNTQSTLSMSSLYMNKTHWLNEY